MVARAFLSLFLALASPLLAVVPSADNGRIQLTLDTTEADQVLEIMDLRAKGKPLDEGRWQRLFATVPYERLKTREAAIAKRFHAPENALKDEDFRKFVLSEELLARAPRLRATLEQWKWADLRKAAERVLEYLPASATIRASVYPTIKPNRNSFVWEAATNPAIFLYLDPDISVAKFENTVAHELHHIGLASAQADYERRIASLPERPRAVADALGGFGEGLAMLAAAGGPEVDPHRASSPADRARWNRDLANFRQDFLALDRFFLDALEGRIADSEAIEEKASSFYGAQGPWYTVGYRMAVMVEKRFGRAALIETMLDPRRLLVLYNRAAAEQNARGVEQEPLWSDEILKQILAEPPGPVGSGAPTTLDRSSRKGAACGEGHTRAARVLTPAFRSGPSAGPTSRIGCSRRASPPSSLSSHTSIEFRRGS